MATRPHHHIDREATGRRLKEALKQNGISAQVLSELLELKSPRGVFRWYNGKTLPDVRHLVVISALLCTPILELIVLKDDDAA